MSKYQPKNTIRSHNFALNDHRISLLQKILEFVKCMHVFLNVKFERELFQMCFLNKQKHL